MILSIVTSLIVCASGLGIDQSLLEMTSTIPYVQRGMGYAKIHYRMSNDVHNSICVMFGHGRHLDEHIHISS
jgi:hypothetical protein